jgi:DNA-binding XRE family transcriptional regulator
MARPSRHKKRDALDYLFDKYIADNPKAQAELEIARANAKIARQVYELRTKTGLTQAQLARLVGTSASVICQLEDSDYRGHSLKMLQRIATALGRRVEVRFIKTRPATKVAVADR